MKQVKSLIKGLLGGFACIALLAGNCFGAEPEVAATVARKMLAAVEANDYDAFMAQKNATFKEAFTQPMFQSLSTHLAPRMQKGYDRLYFGTFNRQGYEIYLWKLTFKDAGDDTLLTLSMKDREVAGFWVK